MNTLQHASVFGGIVLAGGLALASGTATAAGRLRVEDAWLRVDAPGAQQYVGYATLRNTGDAPLTVLAVSSPMFRQTSIRHFAGGQRARELSRLEIAPDQTVPLEAGGLHLVLRQPREAIAPDARVEVVFLMADGTRLTTLFDAHDAPAY